MSKPQTSLSISETLLPIAPLREKVARIARQDGRRRQVWNCVRQMARGNPSGNPWFLPFVAVMEDDAALVTAAKEGITRYLDQAEAQGSSGYLFNIWCFAFPHCRWALWFDFLRRAGCYSAAEADAQAARFLLIQFRDHHAGLRIKPEPECVDNQAAALVLSSYLVGSLFADGPGEGHLARRLREDAAGRIEAMIGGMPAGGYSGEGSTYQGLIVAFAVPFLIEALEHARGQALFDEPLAPNGTRASEVLRMTQRLWTPGGLLLPWDDYGWQFGISFPLAYLAHRTGDPTCLQMLEHDANWSRLHSTSSGWGFDEPIWSLIYWPDAAPAHTTGWRGWQSEHVGAALVDPAGRNYLMQMWDETAPMCIRSHVNPNSLVLVHAGIPLTADGAADANCEALNYPGAIFERNFGAGSFQRMNLSKGCGGSHNVILVDSWEGFRPNGAYAASRLECASADEVVGDVTGLYANTHADCRTVKRRSRLIDGRFWLVEDLVVFGGEHDFTSRWWFRPETRLAPDGVDVRTSDGGMLQMRGLRPGPAAAITRVAGFPVEPDGAGDRVDFAARGSSVRWLWLLWPTTTFSLQQELVDGWTAWPVADLQSAFASPPAAAHALHPGSLPWLQGDVPLAACWHFRRSISVRGLSEPLLRLPRGLCEDTRVWLNGIEIDCTERLRSDLIAAMVPLGDHAGADGQIELELAVRFAVGHSGKHARCSAPDRAAALGCRSAGEQVARYTYDGETVRVDSDQGGHWSTAHRLMEVS